MKSLPTRVLLSLIPLAQPAQFQATTVSAFSTFGACGRDCIVSAISDGVARFTCSAVATPASCVCQPEASMQVYDDIVSCVNYFCAPSSTSIATQILQSYCGGDVLPTTGIQATTTTSSLLGVSQSSAPQTQTPGSASEESNGSPTTSEVTSATSTTVNAMTAAGTSASPTRTGSTKNGLSTDTRDAIIVASVFGGVTLVAMLLTCMFSTPRNKALGSLKTWFREDLAPTDGEHPAGHELSLR